MRKVFFVAFLLAALPAFAGEVAKLGNRGEQVPVFELATLTQRGDETQQQFVMRVGGWLHNYTSGVNEEGCADICRTPEGVHSVRILTNRSHFACTLIERCAPGSSPVGESIHSHPVHTNFQINDVDRAFLRDTRPGQHVPRRLRFIAVPHRFSAQDYKAPGYLVAQGQLLYQRGIGTEKNLGPVTQSQP